jgi:SAM-dependent methyltransferase
VAEETKAHWDQVYRAKAPDQVSWYQERPAVSLALIEAARLPPTARIIDVGGGASRLVDHLLDEGYDDLTVVDISAHALERAQERLGARANRVSWVRQDITSLRDLPPFDLWHDRAVFHFLIHPRDRQRYVEALRSELTVGGSAILATFAPEGPERCSGLPVKRYDADALGAELGDPFELVDARTEQHRTPAGKTQAFTYARFVRRG